MQFIKCIPIYSLDFFDKMDIGLQNGTSLHLIWHAEEVGVGSDAGASSGTDPYAPHCAIRYACSCHALAKICEFSSFHARTDTITGLVDL